MKSVILAGLLSLITAPLYAQDQVTLMLDWFVNPDHGPVIIAQEKGYFADLAISYQPQLHLQIHEGLPLQRVGTLVATPLNCLLVLDDGPIATPADLKGRKVGYSVGGIEEAMLGQILKTHGLSLDDVELINVNWSMSPSLMSGQVDAVIGAFRNFELNQMDIEGVPGRCFYVEEEGLPPYDELIYVANRDTMDVDMIRRFLAATEKATQYIINHPVESWEVFAATAPELNDALNSAAWTDTLPRFALRPAAMDAGRYARFETFLHDAGLIDAPFAVDAIAIDVTAP